MVEAPKDSGKAADLGPLEGNVDDARRSTPDSTKDIKQKGTLLDSEQPKSEGAALWESGSLPRNEEPDLVALSICRGNAVRLLNLDEGGCCCDTGRSKG